MKAKKDNKIYRINDAQKKRYLADGYDIYDDEGNLLEYSPLKKIEYNKYVKVVQENKELKAKIAELEATAPPKEKPLSKMNKGELISKAAELSIEVAEEMTNDSIIALIKETQG